MANMVITDQNQQFPIIEFVKKLNEQIDNDITWKECASIEIIEISKEKYDLLSEFIRGESSLQNNNSRGELLTKVYHAVEFTKGKIDDKENNLPFIVNFLKDYNMPYLEFRDARLPQILQEEIEKDYKDDQATQLKEIADMK